MEDLLLVAESVLVKHEHCLTEDEDDLLLHPVKKEKDYADENKMLTQLQVKEEPKEEEHSPPAAVTLHPVKEEGEEEDNFLAEDPLRMVKSETTVVGEEHKFVANDTAVQSRCQRERRARSRGQAKEVKHAKKHSFKCDLCCTSFARKNNLAVHMRRHTGERRYKCTECNKSFTSKSNLVRHMRRHTGERPYKCSECNRSFMSQAALAYHMRTHRGERPFECDECNRSFTLKSILVFHMHTHTGERPFKCTDCNSSFTRKGHLVSHMRTHTGERPFESDCK